MIPHHIRSVFQTATIAPHLTPPPSYIRSGPSLPSLFLLVILLPLPPLFATPIPRRCAAPSAPSSLHPSHLLRFPLPASPPPSGSSVSPLYFLLRPPWSFPRHPRPLLPPTPLSPPPASLSLPSSPPFLLCVGVSGLIKSKFCCEYLAINFDTEGIRAPAGRAQWISSPSP